MYKYKVGEEVKYGYWYCEPKVCKCCGHETTLGVEDEWIEKTGKIESRNRDFGVNFSESPFTFTQELQEDGTTLNIPTMLPLSVPEKENWYKIDKRTIHEDNILVL